MIYKSLKETYSGVFFCTKVSLLVLRTWSNWRIVKDGLLRSPYVLCMNWFHCHRAGACHNSRFVCISAQYSYRAGSALWLFMVFRGVLFSSVENVAPFSESLNWIRETSSAVFYSQNWGLCRKGANKMSIMGNGLREVQILCEVWWLSGGFPALGNGTGK